MKRIRTFSLFNFFSFIIQAGLFYFMHFRMSGIGIDRPVEAPYFSFLGPDQHLGKLLWGVIYTSLAIFCLYHLKMAFNRPEKHPANVDIARADIFFFINNMAAAGWIITTVRGQVFASLLLLLFQLIILICIHHNLNIYKRYRRLRTTFCTQFPLSIYAAWLSLLLVAGISEYFDLSSERWTIILIAVLTLVSLSMIFIRHNIFFGLMMIPGFYGLITKVELLNTDISDMVLAAWTAIWVLSLASFIKLVMDFRLKEPPVVYNKTVYD